MTTDVGLHGFEVPDGDVPVPQTVVNDDVRERMASVLAAIVCGHTPEQIAGFARADEWPVDVVEMLERPHEPGELAAHVDVLLSVLEGGLR